MSRNVQYFAQVQADKKNDAMKNAAKILNPCWQRKRSDLRAHTEKKDWGEM